MRKLIILLLVLSAVACRKQHDAPVTQPTIKKLEWHVYAADHYPEPWLDNMTARVKVRVYKADTARHMIQTVWDTTFAARTLRQYPVLPQKHVLKKEISVTGGEKLQVWYNVRYEMNGSASEAERLHQAQEPFTFVDVRI
jgi:hypothetical protein